VATTRQYWNQLRTTRNQIGLLMGADVTALSVEQRILSNATLAVIALVVKALTDKGVLADADLVTARNNALGADGSAWDMEPLQPPGVGT
jgi:hypothetical protein